MMELLLERGGIETGLYEHSWIADCLTLMYHGPVETPLAIAQYNHNPLMVDALAARYSPEDRIKALMLLGAALLHSDDEYLRESQRPEVDEVLMLLECPLLHWAPICPIDAVEPDYEGAVRAWSKAIEEAELLRTEDRLAASEQEHGREEQGSDLSVIADDPRYPPLPPLAVYDFVTEARTVKDLRAMSAEQLVMMGLVVRERYLGALSVEMIAISEFVLLRYVKQGQIARSVALFQHIIQAKPRPQEGFQSKEADFRSYIDLFNVYLLADEEHLIHRYQTPNPPELRHAASMVRVFASIAEY